MKKALLWLGPLACLALACLYAYAWFTRDPMAVAFDRIENGLSMSEVESIMARPCDEVVRPFEKYYVSADGSERTVVVNIHSWKGNPCKFDVDFHDGVVGEKRILFQPPTITDQFIRWVREMAGSKDEVGTFE